MSTKNVTIVCKLPHGIIIQVGAKTQQINGCNGVEDNNNLGLTTEVAADFWQAWLVNNKDHDIVKNRLIYADTQTLLTKSRRRKKINSDN